MKGILEVEIFQDGVISELLVEPESEVAVGAVLAIVNDSTEKESSVSQPVNLEVSQPTAKIETPQPEKELAPVNSKPTPLQHELEMVDERLKISPAARRRARELGVKLENSIQGTGHGGAICIADIEKLASENHPGETVIKSTSIVEDETQKENISESPKMMDSTSTNSVKKVDPMRAAIAASMSRSKREIPHFYLSHTIDMTATLECMKDFNENHPITERLVYAVFLIKAVAKALKKYKEFNGYWQNDSFNAQADINVGMAISLRTGGLVAPAIFHADQMNMVELMKAFSDLVNRSRKNQLKASEMNGGTITITSLGERGVEQVFPVIIPPQVAIIGFGSVVKKPWILSDGGMAARDVISVSLAADHRVSDGHRGGLFLARIEKLLQHPEDLL